MVERHRPRPRCDRRGLAFVLGIRIPAVDGVDHGTKPVRHGGRHDQPDAAEHRQALDPHLAVDRRTLAAHELLERRRVELLEELVVIECEAGQRTSARRSGSHPQQVEREQLEHRGEQHPGVDLVGLGRLDEVDDRVDLGLDVGDHFQQRRLVDVLLAANASMRPCGHRRVVRGGGLSRSRPRSSRISADSSASENVSSTHSTRSLTSWASFWKNPSSLLLRRSGIDVHLQRRPASASDS